MPPDTSGDRLTKADRPARSTSWLGKLGPGLVTGAADDDPSGVATYSQAGAQAGLGFTWTMVAVYPLMVAIQLTSAQIGRVTGKGLAAALADCMPRRAVGTLVALLFVANTINVGADLAAMGAVGELTTGLDRHWLTVGFAAVSLLLQLFVPFKRYVRFLKWLTLALLAYVAVVFVVKLDWLEVARSLVVPELEMNRDTAITIVAILGTTISPYLFFWQAAEEVEDLDQDPRAHPLNEAPRQARGAFQRIRIDTFVGMAVSNLVAIAIMLSTAATLHAQGITQINSAADAAKALEPAAGPFASILFSIGIIGTGLLAVPVLAGSAAYAVADSRGWKCGLDHKPWQAARFYGVIAAATLIGLAIAWSPIDPMRALYWSAVVNGVIAVPIMAAMMVVGSRRDEMGRFTIGPFTRIFGWLATATMATASGAMAYFTLA